MKTTTAILAALTMAVAAPALAQTAMPNAPATPDAAAVKPYTTGNTPIGTLLADPAAKAIVDKHIPGFSDNPQIGMVSGATLLQIQPMKPDLLTDKLLADIDADLAKLPTK